MTLGMKPVNDTASATLATTAKRDPHLTEPSCTADQAARLRIAGNHVHNGGAFLLRHQTLSLGKIGLRLYDSQKRCHGLYAIDAQ